MGQDCGGDSTAGTPSGGHFVARRGEDSLLSPSATFQKNASEHLNPCKTLKSMQRLASAVTSHGGFSPSAFSALFGLSLRGRARAMGWGNAAAAAAAGGLTGQAERVGGSNLNQKRAVCPD